VALTAAALAELAKGELRGDGSVEVDRLASLDRAGPRDASFLASPKYAAQLSDSNAGVILMAPAFADLPGRAPARILVERPHEAIQSLLPALYDLSPPEPWIAPTARLGRGVVLEDGVRIEDYVVIGDRVRIGGGTRLYSNVTVYAGTEIGARCIIHSGARLGSDGFGYVFQNGRHVKIPHVGRCIIGDEVEVGANSTIDRGSIDDTVIGAGTKIDNLVHVGHNVRIGRACLLMAEVGIAGSAHIGDGVILAGQVGVSGHVNIGSGARIGGQACVMGDVPPGESWSGYPARPHKQSMRATAAMFRLAPIIGALERLVGRKNGEGEA